MACWCDDGWVCENHSDQPMNHDPERCGGAGQPCENPDCPHGQQAQQRKPIDQAIDRERYPDLIKH